MVNTEFYKNAKIYKIVDNTNGNVYIGSTCKKLCQRLVQHRANYKRYQIQNGRFTSSFEILKNNDYDIVLLENYPCNNKEELRQKEREYIEKFKCVNKNIPNRTQKEYKMDNKNKILEKHKNYYQENKDKLLADNKKYHKDNKEKIRERKKDYREKNIEKIKKRLQENICCECGYVCKRDSMRKHIKTLRHQQLLLDKLD